MDSDSNITTKNDENLNNSPHPGYVEIKPFIINGYEGPVYEEALVINESGPSVQLEVSTTGTETIVHTNENIFQGNTAETTEHLITDNEWVQDYIQTFIVDDSVIKEQLSFTSNAQNTEFQPQKSYPCTFKDCGKVFYTSAKLKSHEKSHSVGQYRCNVCPKVFKTSYACKTHMRTHTGETPYECGLCDKKFKVYGDLTKHMRTHTGERPFACSVCHKSFTTSNIRNVHMRVHTGERPYKCQYENCGRSFASATNYKNHTRIHTGEKPYVCSYEKCKKRFTEYSSLYKHLSVHNNNKSRYTCNICEVQFRQQSAFKLHTKTAHSHLTDSSSSSQTPANQFILLDTEQVELISANHSIDTSNQDNAKNSEETTYIQSNNLVDNKNVKIEFESNTTVLSVEMLSKLVELCPSNNNSDEPITIIFEDNVMDTLDT